jgi:hypothetical protein
MAQNALYYKCSYTAGANPICNLRGTLALKLNFMRNTQRGAHANLIYNLRGTRGSFYVSINKKHIEYKINFFLSKVSEQSFAFYLYWSVYIWKDSASYIILLEHLSEFRFINHVLRSEHTSLIQTIYFFRSPRYNPM